MAENTDLLVIGLSSLFLSAIVTIIIQGAFLGVDERMTIGNFKINNSFFQNNLPQSDVCPPGVTSCDSSITKAPSQDITIWDALQGYFNIGLMILKLVFLISIATIFPLSIYLQTLTLTSNTLILSFIFIFTLLWQVVIVYSVIKYIFKK